MSSGYGFDTEAIIAFLYNEPGHEAVAARLDKVFTGSADGFLTEVNVPTNRQYYPTHVNDDPGKYNIYPIYALTGNSNISAITIYLLIDPYGIPCRIRDKSTQICRYHLLIESVCTCFMEVPQRRVSPANSPGWEIETGHEPSTTSTSTPSTGIHSPCRSTPVGIPTVTLGRCTQGLVQASM